MSAYIRKTPRRNMTALASLRRRIQKLTPYFSLLLLAVPVLLVEPVKFVAVFVAAKGHWLAATGMIICAYAVSLVLVERLFRAVKPKLLMLNWFAKLWVRYTTLRDKVVAMAKGRRSSTDLRSSHELGCGARRGLGGEGHAGRIR
jgi:hypothetical protein